MRYRAFYISGLAIALLSMTTAAHAGGAPTTPEIDGVSLSAGLGLLAAGVLLIRSRRRSK